MSSGAAREHVRVARALRDLPVIRGEFGTGRLSYAKVRALTRIATADNEAGLAEIAGPMTGNQLERFARAHRQASPADDAAARLRRRLAWRVEEDGSLAGTFRLPPLQGAVLLKALRAAAGDLEHPHDPGHDGVSAETPEPADKPSPPRLYTSSSLADALVAVAEAFVGGKVAAAKDPEVYQVIVHVGTGALTGADDREGVSAETPPPAVPGHPADPQRCHVEDGPAVPVSTAQMLACSAALSWMRHGADGAVLDVGRRRRRPTTALRRAARERDGCRCRFPGCDSRRVDLHHIRHWANGGPTSLANLVSLCKRHHMLVHDRGYLITAKRGGPLAFSRPDGTPIGPSPALPPPDGTIGDCHDADIAPGTIIPPWYGERLDLDHAICTCLANAENQARRAQQQAHQDQPGHPGEPEPFRPRGLVSEPSDWIATILKHRADQGGEDSADPGRRGTPASSPPLR